MDKALLQADINLLKVLLVLLEERNVTHAADKLYVSQPAISKSLRRLRQMFGDPLFVRSPNGLIATTRAVELELPVRRVIEAVGHLLQTTPFDPAQARGVVRIAAPESFVLGSIPNLAVKLLDIAPELSLEMQHIGDDYLARLAAGELEYAIYLEKPYPEGFVATPIVVATPRIWFRDGHPLASKKKITLADTCAYPQVAFRSPNVSHDDIRIVERAMKDIKLQRKVMLSTSHLLIALGVLMKTNALMLGPDYLSRLPEFSSGISSHAVDHIPAFRHMQIKLVLVQHMRNAGSPLHRWMSAEILRAFSQYPHTA